jgi:hypothetical protein
MYSVLMSLILRVLMRDVGSGWMKGMYDYLVSKWPQPRYFDRRLNYCDDPVYKVHYTSYLL